MALQKMLSLKQDKGQKKYEKEMISANLSYLLLMSLDVAVERWFLTLFCSQDGTSIIKSKVAEESDRHQDVSQWSSSGLFCLFL